MIEFIWDEPKRQASIEKHGLDFAALDPDFFLGAIVHPAKSSRFKAVRRFADGTIAVIFAHLGNEGLSIISMRPASPQEQRLL